jgi:hypothetical protein
MQTIRHTQETHRELYLALPNENKKTVLKKFTVENDLFEEMVDSEIAKKKNNERSPLRMNILKKRVRKI